MSDGPSAILDYVDHEESPEKAQELFEQFGHVLKGEVEVHSSGLCCGGFWYMLRCERCNWYWLFDPIYDHEFRGPSDELRLPEEPPQPTCLGLYRRI